MYETFQPYSKSTEHNTTHTHEPTAQIEQMLAFYCIYLTCFLI